MKISRARFIVASAGLSLVMPLSANAANWWGSAPSDRLTIAARSAVGRDTIHLSPTQALTGPAGAQTYILRSRGSIIGEVSFEYAVGDPHSLPLNFTVVAGDLDTEFFISVPNRNFTAVNNALAQANANVVLTDLNGDGASATGNYGNGDFYRWDYNGTVPNGTLFQTQVQGPINALPNSIGQAGENTPTGPNFTPIIQPVSILSGRVNFTLSALDQARGSGLFQILVPAPGLVSIVGIAGLSAISRRRR